MGTNRSPRRRLSTAACVAALTVGAWAGMAPSASAAAVGPLQLSATSGAAGTAINVGGTGCVPILGIGSVTGLVVKSGLSITTFSATPNAQGAWSSPVVVPTGSAPGLYVITAVCVGLGLPYAGVSYTVTAPPTTTAAPATTAAPGPLPTVAVTIPVPVLTVPTTAPRATTTAPKATTTVKPGVIAGTPTTAVDTGDDPTDPDGGNQKTTGDDGTDGTNGANGVSGVSGAAGAGGAGGAAGSAGGSSGTSGGTGAGSDGSASATSSGGGSTPGAELASREVAADGTELASGSTAATGKVVGHSGIGRWVWVVAIVLSAGIIGGGLWYARFRNVQLAGWWKQWMGEHTTQWWKPGRK